MKFSLIIPMYNEKSIIEDTAKTLSAYMQEHFEDYEILFSNDGSLDGCDEIVRSFALPCVRVVGYETNRGKGCAIRHAMMEASGDWIMFTDADLAYGVDVIAQFAKFGEEISAEKNRNSPAVVIGSRNLGKDGYESYTLIRKIMSKTYIKVLCLAGGFKLSDSQCGCKMFRREEAREIFRRCEVNGFAFDFEAILWANKLGYSIAELPVKVINHRESKVRIVRDTLRMLKDLRKMKKRIKKTPV